MRVKMINRRKDLGYSQQELANKLGVTRSAVSGWEIGRNEPDLQTIIKLKEILRVKEDAFFLDDKVTKRDNTIPA